MRALTDDQALEIVASQQHGVLERTGLTAAQTDVAAWTVTDDGPARSVVGGARAIGLALAVGRGATWPLLPWRVPGVGWLADRLYSLVAALRHRLPGETSWCLAHPDRCIDAVD